MAKASLCAAGTCQKDDLGSHAMIAERTPGIGDRWPPVTSALRYGVTVWTLSSRKWTKSVETDHATSMRARARASWGFTGGAGDMTLASDQTLPGRRKGRLLCGAKTRAGGCCQVRAEPGKARCRFHGGKSTGPKTPAGRARIAEAQRLRWLA
jgi:hypothetical protein